MITDRTYNDVARWKELHDKGWAAMTAAERSEWMGDMKGRYSYSDMNRVESAVEELSKWLYEAKYLKAPLTVKTDWNLWSVPTRSDMTRYLGNISVLREAVAVYPTTPMAPTVDQRLTYDRANDIEQILVDLYEISTNIRKAWLRSGEIYSGEV